MCINPSEVHHKMSKGKIQESVLLLSACSRCIPTCNGDDKQQL